MGSVLNTPYETSLRILLLLSVDSKPRTTEMIAMMDFICTYGKHFGVADANLHGDNRYKYGEFAARRMLIRKAMKLLVSDGMLDIYSDKNRFGFRINDEGMDYCVTCLSGSSFASEFKATAVNVIKCIENRTEDELSRYIHASNRYYERLPEWGYGGKNG